MERRKVLATKKNNKIKLKTNGAAERTSYEIQNGALHQKEMKETVFERITKSGSYCRMSYFEWFNANFLFFVWLHVR
jgi:hypothetical protein